MNPHDRARVIFHGAIVMFFGFLCGFPAGLEQRDPTPHLWTSAHHALLTIGIWLLAMATVFPALARPKRTRRARLSR